LPNIDAARTCVQEPRDLRLLIIGPKNSASHSARPN